MKYIDEEKLISEIERWRDKEKEKYNESIYSMGRCDALAEFRNHIISLQQEQPDNEDIDKVAQELYEHLYELKRRNNVPTNLYDKQEIIDLWKAGIEYGRNHPKQEQPETSNNLVDVDAVREDFITEVYRVLDADPTNDRANAIINAFDSLPTVSQEQPAVELEDDFFFDEVLNVFDSFKRLPPRDKETLDFLENLARHFWNKGYNARKEE